MSNVRIGAWRDAGIHDTTQTQNKTHSRKIRKQRTRDTHHVILRKGGRKDVKKGGRKILAKEEGPK